jgi:hypothetical protein
MDTRLARNFAQDAMEDALNFPLYQPIQGWGLASNIRRAGFAFFGIYGTERNKQWLQQVEAGVPKGELCALAIIIIHSRTLHLGRPPAKCHTIVACEMSAWYDSSRIRSLLPKSRCRCR